MSLKKSHRWVGMFCFCLILHPSLCTMTSTGGHFKMTCLHRLTQKARFFNRRHNTKGSSYQKPSHLHCKGHYWRRLWAGSWQKDNVLVTALMNSNVVTGRGASKEEWWIAWYTETQHTLHRASELSCWQVKKAAGDLVCHVGNAWLSAAYPCRQRNGDIKDRRRG